MTDKTANIPKDLEDYREHKENRIGKKLSIIRGRKYEEKKMETGDKKEEVELKKLKETLKRIPTIELS